jgi:hypothetical protein
MAITIDPWAAANLAGQNSLLGQAASNTSSQGLINQSRMYRADRWETGTATTRFTVTKASNGYILEAGDEIYVADTVEHVQGIVATLLIAKGG